MQNIATIRRIGTLMLLIGPLTTLAVSPYSNFDPINLIKMIFVSSFAFAALFLISTSWKTLLPRLDRGIWTASGCFLFWLTLVLVTKDLSFSQQFWGVFGRNNGYLAYFALLVVLLSAALIQEKTFYHKLVDALVLTSIPTTAYALVQMFGRDPIPWSVMAPFATLGNINFSSAFFGLASICATVLALAPNQALWLRIGLASLVAINLLIVLDTGSIQGFMIYLAGIGIVGFYLVRSSEFTRRLQIPYLLLGVLAFALTSLALKNVGPFARFIFGETILFRLDYWYAGWEMTIRNPFLGVGLDSYGDWYREVRGEIATLRTVPDRITNTAHNIYLDISASGGFPLILSYALLLGYAIRAAIRLTRRSRAFDPYFVALFSAWVAYLIQAAISINQIGVGIWGWLFTGALIGYEITTREPGSSGSTRKTHNKSPQLPASVALLGILGFTAGFVVAFVPFRADMAFKDALQSGDMALQADSAKALGATAYHLELALDAALKANDEVLAKGLTDEILSHYPRNFMAWRVKQVLAISSPIEREAAYKRLRALDPYNPDIQRVG